MRRFASKLATSTVLSLGLCLLAGPGARSADEDTTKQIAAAQKDILELVKTIEKGGDGVAQAKAIRGKYEDLNVTMAVFKPTAKGGIGYGKKGPGDGIELKIINLGKVAMAPMALKAQKDQLIRLGYINLAMVEIAHAYTPMKPKAGKGAKEWKEYTEDMRKSSKDLIEAVKTASPGKLKAAAANLNTSCNTCHSDFRD